MLTGANITMTTFRAMQCLRFVSRWWFLVKHGSLRLDAGRGPTFPSRYSPVLLRRSRTNKTFSYCEEGRPGLLGEAEGLTMWPV
jgi:hypothetical protein